ncbi:MAG: tautomerase family protein [Candidatus Odinarchaeota archaeon]
MPVVQITVWAGMSDECKRCIVEGITKTFESVGIPKEAVEIIIYETPKSNWATGGERHSDSKKFANMKAP